MATGAKETARGAKEMARGAKEMVRIPVKTNGKSTFLDGGKWRETEGNGGKWRETEGNAQNTL